MRLRPHHVLRRAHAGFADVGPVLRFEKSASHRVLVESTVFGVQKRRFGATQRIFGHARHRLGACTIFASRVRCVTRGLVKNTFAPSVRGVNNSVFPVPKVFDKFVPFCTYLPIRLPNKQKARFEIRVWLILAIREAI